MLDGAAVAGDPFEPELAAAAAGDRPSQQAMDAVDELLELDLVAPTERAPALPLPPPARAARRLRGDARRLAARRARAVRGGARRARRHGAGARAHHVERSAREGDVAAVAVLREAGEAAARLRAGERGALVRRRAAPAPAVRAGGASASSCCCARASALAATGRFAESHDALLESLALVPERRARAADQADADVRRASSTSSAATSEAHARLASGARRACPTPARPRRSR